MAHDNLAPVLALIQKHWGYSALRPLQAEAMTAVLQGRDSFLVVPTGAGKSLCFQAPAMERGGTTVVVSPLIALMKDQVDGLRACGIPAVQLDSSLLPEEKRSYAQDLLQGAIRLLYVSPERLVSEEFCQFLKRVGVHTFAIDEAHCISHWGHDFRPEYRQLGKLKDIFPQAAIHAYTATATERVREDIVKQLGLRNPVILVGSFDRPNLSYRVVPRVDKEAQVLEMLERHKNEAGIIYCLRRKDVDEVSADLQAKGVNCKPYHAGLSQEDRKSAQDAFSQEQCNIIVATIAFGMGIDRSNIRFILHANMPKSVEHYQQETGRAGRDGLEAECVLLHSGEDIQMWKWICQKSVEENKVPPDFLANMMRHLNDMDAYARGSVCRHRALVNYFGQKYEADNCAACDLCLGDTEPVPDAVVIAQKILSCVARVQERFGINHVISVLRGENSERIQTLNHDKLTTYGLLKEHDKKDLRDWIYQLIGQDALRKEGDEYPILKLTEVAWEVMRKLRAVRLVRPLRAALRQSRADLAAWEGVDRGLFEELRQFRKKLADARGFPPYVIMSDATLRELAQQRPSNVARLKFIRGIGEAKLREMGEAILKIIVLYCKENQIPMDVAWTSKAARPAKVKQHVTGAKARAFDLFREKADLEDVQHQLNRSHGTIIQYLCDYIRRERPDDISLYVPKDIYDKIAAAIREVGSGQLKPIFVTLEEKVPYDQIRLVVEHLRV
ncbi:MAG: DNA helicase RecQ [Gemmataceae bacterium]|nr:DNA helicase RecQ [Gemmataceae bacterium]